jgi:serine kinase of HPr protein (carbohydrate metabolism regulator)
MAADAATTHASAVLIGPKAALIRGPAGSGKSQLVWDLLQVTEFGALPFARLVGDDRVHVDTHAGRLLVRPAAQLAGLLEIRGLGIRHLPYEPVAAVALPSARDRKHRHWRGFPAAAGGRTRNAGPAHGAGVS